MLPGAATQPARRRGAHALPRLRLSAVAARTGVAVLAGIATGFCFAPFDLGLVAVLTIAPLLFLWRDARPGPAALYGLAFGIGVNVVVLAWIRSFGVVAIVPLVLAMALAPAVVGVGVALLRGRGVASPWLTAAIWVLTEALRARYPFGGFPWTDVGLTLHDLVPALAWTSVAGAAVLSFLVVATAGLLVDLVVSWRAQPRRATAWAAGALGAIVVLVAVGPVVRYDPRPTGGLRVALIQGEDTVRTLDEQQRVDLTDEHLALADRLRGPYDLVVFPESALSTDPRRDVELAGAIAAIAREHDTAVLVNARTVDVSSRVGAPRYRNTNLLYDPDGSLQGVYAKQHLVPFGEYVPLREQLSFIGELRQVPYDFVAGERRRTFDVAGRRVASVICFESAFSPLVSELVRDGSEAIVVSTNARSYRRSGSSAQHLALAQVRAAETARPVVQASLSGISAIVDPDGRVRDETALFERTVVSTHITTASGETPYVRLGDWFLVVCAVGVLAATIVAVRRRAA